MWKAEETTPRSTSSSYSFGSGQQENGLNWIENISVELLAVAMISRERHFEMAMVLSAPTDTNRTLSGEKSKQSTPDDECGFICESSFVRCE